MKLILFVALILFSFTSKASIDTVNIVGNTSLELLEGKEIFSKESDWWDRYSSGIIAGITVFTSLGISVWQARATQKQSRDNSISEARIQWIQELRPLLSQLISEASEMAETFKQLEKYIDKETLTTKKNMSDFESKDFKEKGMKNIKLQSQFESTFNQIKLFLNRKEPEHRELLKLIKEFVENSRRELRESDYKNNLKTGELIVKAQIVLKNAWEQAKNEGKNRYSKM